MNRAVREHGTITRVWLGNELVIFLSDPKYAEVRTTEYRGILTNREQHSNNNWALNSRTKEKIKHLTSTIHISHLCACAAFGKHVTTTEFLYTALCYASAVHRPSVFTRCSNGINTVHHMTHTDLTVSGKRCESSLCATESTRQKVPSDCGRLK